LGHPQLDRYLEFVSARARPNTVLATGYDLKVFFSVVSKDPAEVTTADVLGFITAQRGDRKVVRLVDGESGLSARTIQRRLSSISGFYGFLLACDEVEANPVPRGLSNRKRSRVERGTPLVRTPRTLPKILEPAEVDELVAACRRWRDRAMVEAMVLGGLRRMEVLGLRLEDLKFGERRVFVVEGKGGHQRIVPISARFFDSVARYLEIERPKRAATDRLFVVLKGPNRGRPLTLKGRSADCVGEGTSRFGALHLPRAASHLFHPAPGGRHVTRSHPGSGRAPVDRIDPDLSPFGQRLAR
jgi:site-specific recombinase XerD